MTTRRGERAAATTISARTRSPRSTSATSSPRAPAAARRRSPGRTSSRRRRPRRRTTTMRTPTWPPRRWTERKGRRAIRADSLGRSGGFWCWMSISPYVLGT
uniref:Uncharacterized protein n=1 Tax=Arundo donax TaxID=35708 RepID=A0A0A9CZ85_ARUDO